MTYGTQQNIWATFVFLGVAVELTLIIWLIAGIVKKNRNQIKTSVKFLINSTSSFSFVLFPFVYFGLWVNGPHGQPKQLLINLLNKDMQEAIMKWYLWAFLWLSVLLVFNIFYQTKLERHKSWGQTICIFLIDFTIMSFGILYPAFCAYQYFLRDINMQTY